MVEAKRIAGSIRSVGIAGIPYTPAADINVTEMISGTENSSIPGVGSNMRKMVSRAATREGIVILTDADQLLRLKAIADGVDDVVLSYTNAAGDVARTSGWIEVENNETEETRTTVQMHPRLDWNIFIGEAN